MARTGLGRGLDVLLGQPPHADAPLGLTSASTEIPLEKVMPNRQQPRTSFDSEGLSELAASIRQHGVLQPIVVSRDGDGYELIARLRKLPGGRTVPAVALTALARSEDRTRALRAGFQLHVPKPVDSAELITVVQNLAALRSQAS